MRKWIFASLIFFCVQVEAFSLNCQQETTEGLRSGALQNFNMYDIESPERTSTITDWTGIGEWQWGDTLVQWSYENSDGKVVMVQFARTPFEGLLQRQVTSLVGDVFIRADNPHGVAVRCGLENPRSRSRD